MLNGIAPLMIIVLKTPAASPVDLSIGSILADYGVRIDWLGGIPIPIYFDDRGGPLSANRIFGGIFVENESKNIDIQTETEQTLYSDPSSKEIKIKQKGVNSSISISVVAKNNSPALMLLMGLADRIFERSNFNDSYSVSYFHGPFILFGAKFTSLSISPGVGEDVYNIQMTLTYATAEPKEPEPAGAPSKTVIPRTDGAQQLQGVS